MLDEKFRRSGVVALGRVMQGTAAVEVSGGHIRAGLDQQLQHRQPGKLRRRNQRSGATAIAGVHLGTVGQQQTNDRLAILIGGPMQWGPSKLVLKINLGTVVEEMFDDPDVRAANRLVEQRVANGIHRVGQAGHCGQALGQARQVSVPHALPDGIGGRADRLLAATSQCQYCGQNQNKAMGVGWHRQ